MGSIGSSNSRVADESSACFGWLVTVNPSGNKGLESGQISSCRASIVDILSASFFPEIVYALTEKETRAIIYCDYFRVQ